MAGDKLATLKLLMEGEDFDWTPSKDTVPDCHNNAGVQFDFNTSVPETNRQDDTLQARISPSSKPTEPVISTSENQRVILEAQKPKNEIGSSFAQPQLSDFVTLDPEKRLLGQVAPPKLSFSPILAISKYPYKYMPSPTTESEEVSQKFFAGGIFWRRRWTM